MSFFFHSLSTPLTASQYLLHVVAVHLSISDRILLAIDWSSFELFLSLQQVCAQVSPYLSHRCSWVEREILLISLKVHGVLLVILDSNHQVLSLAVIFVACIWFLSLLTTLIFDYRYSCFDLKLLTFVDQYLVVIVKGFRFPSHTLIAIVCIEGLIQSIFQSFDLLNFPM